MKKIISMVLSFILILGCSTTAFAAETHNYDTEILNFSVKVDWCLEGICKVLHENVKGLQFPKTHNNF